MTAPIFTSALPTVVMPHKVIQKVFPDKGYYGEKNREFLNLHQIDDGSMRKATRSTRLAPYEKERNKAIPKIKYIVEQYYGISHLHHHSHRARFTRLIKKALDALLSQLAFNLVKGTMAGHRKEGGVSYEPRMTEIAPE